MLPVPPIRVLTVGIDNYQTGNLEYCVADAEKFGEILKFTPYEFEVDFYLDPEITRDSLQERLENFFSREASAYIFYFSGHAYKTRFSCSFITSELKKEDFGKGLKIDYLNNLIQNSATKTASVLIVLDCCSSGYFNITNEDIAEVVSTGNGRVLLASCLPHQESKQTSVLKSSKFSFYLTEGLLGNAVNHNGDVTISSLHAYIAAEMKRDFQQTPLFMGSFPGDMILGSAVSNSKSVTKSFDLIVSELEGEASRYQQMISDIMQDYQKNMERWINVGFKRASRELPSILQWFERKYYREKSEKIRPALENSAIFMASKNVARLSREQMAASVNVGMKVSRGIIIRELGQGGFGTVWLVEDENGKKWAYKTCHSSVFQDHEKVQWFERGFNGMSKLDHPHIVTVHPDNWTEAPMGFYMRYISGTNWRKSAPSPYKEFDDILADLHTLASALKYAHSVPDPVFHRDIKPENILIDYNEKGEDFVVLTDFDLAWFGSASTIIRDPSHHLNLFLSYGAPEFTANPYSSESEKATVDVYSFGQLIYFAFTNQDPGRGSDNANRLREAVARKKPSADAVEELIQLYNDCTQKDIGQRLQTMDEVLLRLYRVQLASETGLSIVTPHKFLRQVMLILGIQNYREHDLTVEFSTLTGKFRYIFTLKPDKYERLTVVEITCIPEDNIKVDHAVRYRDAAGVLFSRLESNIPRVFDAKRYKCDIGINKTFEVYLYNVELSQVGIDEVIAVINEVKKQLEL